MRTVQIPLGAVAYARSGDKGASANIGVIAYNQAGYECIDKALDAERVREFFAALGPRKVVKYKLPNLGALNFVLEGVLDGGGSRSLRTDAQGKALGQAILELRIEVPESMLTTIVGDATWIDAMSK